MYKVGKKVANLVHRKSILYARMPIFVCKVGRIETNLVHYYTKGGGQWTTSYVVVCAIA